MSDIVARLHAVYSTHPMVMEAAAEIKRLQEQVTTLRELREYDQAEIRAIMSAALEPKP